MARSCILGANYGLENYGCGRIKATASVGVDNYFF